MISLIVLSFNGAAADGGLRAQFDELGGTIGRADNNQLVLPDPERTISRVHAQIVYRNGKYAVVDRGSNPISVNGRPLGSGVEAPIAAGDQLQVGGYLLKVEAGAGAAAANPSDPFADLLGPAAAAPAPRAAGTPPPLIDPLAAFAAAPPAGGGGGAGADPFAGFGHGAGAPAAPAGAGGIPDDWDPFSAPAPAASARGAPADLSRSLGSRPGAFGLDGGAAAPPPLIPDMPTLGGAGGDSIDNLFGLKPSGGADPLANSILDTPMSAPNMAASGDPMASLRAAPRASSATIGDDFSDLNRPFQSTPMHAPGAGSAAAPAASRAAEAGTGLGRGHGEGPGMAPMSPPAAARPAPAAPPPGVVLSWDQGAGEERTVVRPKAGSRPPAQVAADPALDPLAAFGVPSAPSTAGSASTSGGGIPDDLDLMGLAPVRPRPPAPARAPAPPAPASAQAASAPASSAAAAAAAGPAALRTPGASPDAQSLLAAFRDGLATPSVQIDSLTPELMTLIGQLLREAAAGTVDLLVSRAAVKREIRAEATMIVARENNPLKFSPSAEAALGHLLAPPTRGFMAAAPAMRDAYDDLRAHQYGFVAGMRAALEGVLERFDPAQLEARLTQRSALHTLLPATRKARLWELFTDLYASLRNEAADDFHAVFGKAFLKAYEEHIDQLQGGRQ